MKLKDFLILSTLYSLCSTSMIGCATTSMSVPLPSKGILGVYHRVKERQTLWRIAKIYNVKLDELTRINRLSDTSRIYPGQLIFIPNAKEVIENLTLEIDFKDRGGDFIWPVKGKVVSFFGMKKDRVKNKGIYIKAAERANVLAARSGKVAFCSDRLKGYGKIIIINHLDSYSTVYAFNEKSLVGLNQLVKQGEVIAKAGLNGRTKDQNDELYFEIRKSHKPQNPFFYLP